MILYIDSREQLPLDFMNRAVFKHIVREALPYGDYMASKDELSPKYPLSFERKSIGDLFGTMTHGYDRFKREYERAAADKAQLVLIIEGRLIDVYMGYEHSQYKGDSMLKKLFTLWVKYDIIPVFCDSRRAMVRFIEETFDAIQRNWK